LKNLIRGLAFVVAAVFAVAAAPQGSLTVQVVSASGTNGDTSLQAALGSVNVTDAWPFSDANGNSVELADVIGNSSINITNTGSGYDLGAAIISGSAGSIQTTSLTQQLNTGTGANAIYLRSTGAWTMGIGLLPSSLPSSGDFNVWSTGDPLDNHTGVEEYVTSGGAVDVAFGTGSGSQVIQIASSIPTNSSTFTSFTQGSRAYVTFTPTQGSSSGAGTATVTFGSGATTSVNVPNFSAGSTPLGVAINVSNTGGVAKAFQGYLAYMFYAPNALSSSSIGIVDTAFTTTTSQQAASGYNPTLPAAVVSNFHGFDSQYEGYSNERVESYLSLRNSDSTATQAQVDANPVTRLIKNLQGHQIRDSSNVGKTTSSYTPLCADGILTDAGFNYNNGPSTATATNARVYGDGTWLTSAANVGDTTLHVNSTSYTAYTATNTPTKSFTTGMPIVVDIWGNYGTVTNRTQSVTVTGVDASSKVITITPALTSAHVIGSLVDDNSGDEGTVGTGAYDLPIPTSLSSITTYWDNRKTYTGCYPGMSELENEPDGWKSEQLTDPASPTGAPFYATLSTRTLETSIAARNSNSKYAGIKLLTVGLSSDSNDFHLAQAAFDFSTMNPSFSIPIHVDGVSQHTGYSPNAPELANGILAKGSYPFSTYNGHAAYDKNYSPLWETEFGLANNGTMYPGCSSCMSDDLAAHQTPRVMLADIAFGVQKALYDFPSNHVCTSITTPFCGDGWMDEFGQVGGGAYAAMNLVKKIGEPSPIVANSCSDPSQISPYNPPQLNYTVSGGTNSATDKPVSYSFVKCDGTMWLVLNRAVEEWTATTFGNGKGYVMKRAPFEAVTVHLGNPSAYPNVTIFQNDEYCNAPYPEPPLVEGAPKESRPSNPVNTDCYQYWPAGSLGNHNNPTNPTVSGGSFSININGMPVVIELTNGAPAPVATYTPFPVQSIATPSATYSGPTYGNIPSTPVPYFSPPAF
jgi:hypothetical protein